MKHVKSKWSLKGIDLSAYNHVRDYEKVANDNVDFVILKIIRKDSLPDKLFETHWSGFENIGVPIQGVYNYSYATTVEKFKSDAKKVISVLNGRKTMVWLDIEDSCLKTIGRTLIDGIKAYADVISSAGLEFGIYTYVSFYNTFLKSYASELNYPFWVARYPSSKNMDIDLDPSNKNCPVIGKTTYGWQYSSKGKVDGIVGDVDLNVWFTDIEATECTNNHATSHNYRDEWFKKELARNLGLNEMTPANEILKHTVTINTSKNKNHSSVTALERLLKTYGYYTGIIESDYGREPVFGNGMSKATYMYQANVVGLKKPDKEWTAKNKSYKTALGID